MDYKEAEKKILKRHKLLKVSSALDFGTFFVFSLVPFYQKDGEVSHSGTIFPAIDKKTGKEFKYDLTSDPEAFHKAKRIKVT